MITRSRTTSTQLSRGPLEAGPARICGQLVQTSVHYLARSPPGPAPAPAWSLAPPPPSSASRWSWSCSSGRCCGDSRQIWIMNYNHIVLTPSSSPSTHEQRRAGGCSYTCPRRSSSWASWRGPGRWSGRWCPPCRGGDTRQDRQDIWSGADWLLCKPRHNSTYSTQHTSPQFNFLVDQYINKITSNEQITSRNTRNEKL